MVTSVSAFSVFCGAAAALVLAPVLPLDLGAMGLHGAGEGGNYFRLG